MNKQINKNELITEVDENNRILGLKPRSYFENGDSIHRSSYLLLFDLNDRILLQKRAMYKKWYPGKYTFPVAGTVTDETYKECMQREIQEAFGKSLKFSKLFDYKHFEKVDKAFKRVFISDTNPNSIGFKTDYADSYWWISLDKIKIELEEDAQKFAPPFLTGMQIFFENYQR
ncbi:MAG: NUDIX domain-containing protein [Patescibacteria group bacterium]